MGKVWNYIKRGYSEAPLKVKLRAGVLLLVVFLISSLFVLNFLLASRDTVALETEKMQRRLQTLDEKFQHRSASLLEIARYYTTREYNTNLLSFHSTRDTEDFRPAVFWALNTKKEFIYRYSLFPEVDREMVSFLKKRNFWSDSARLISESQDVVDIIGTSRGILLLARVENPHPATNQPGFVMLGEYLDQFFLKSFEEKAGFKTFLFTEKNALISSDTTIAFPMSDLAQIYKSTSKDSCCVMKVFDSQWATRWLLLTDFEGEKLGLLGGALGLELDLIQRAKKGILFSALVVLLVGILLAGVLVRIFDKILLSSLHSLRRVIKELIDNHEFKQKLEVKTRDDIGELTQSFNLLMEKLEQEEKTLRKEHRKLLALNAISQAVSQSLNLKVILNEALDIILEISGFEVGIIFLWDRQEQRLIPQIWKGIEIGQNSQATPLVKADSSIWKTYYKRQIFLVEDLKSYEGITDKAFWQENKIESLICLPVIAQGEILGILSLGGLQRRQIGFEDTELYSAAARQLALALDNARLLSEWTKKAEQLNLLLEVFTAISSTLELEKILVNLADKISKLSESEFCWICLLDDAREKLTLKVMNMKNWDDFAIKPKESFNLDSLEWHSRVINSRESVILDKTGYESLSFQEKKLIQLDKASYALILPISFRQKSLGTVCLGLNNYNRSLNKENIYLYQSLTSQTAVALENAQLYEYLKERVEEVSFQYSIAQSLSSILNMDELLDRILESLLTSFVNCNCAIFLVDEEKKVLVLRAARGVQKNLADRGQLKIGEEGICGWVAFTGQPVLANDVTLDQRYISGWTSSKSELSVPLKLGNRVIGVLDVESEQKNFFTDKHLRILTGLAPQLSIVLENSRLFREQKLETQRLSLINQITQKAVTPGNLTDFLPSAAAAVASLLGEDCSVEIFLADQDNQELILKASFAAKGKKPPLGYRQKIGSGVIGETAQGKTTVLVDDVSLKPNYLTFSPEVKSELCIPLLLGEEVLGVVNLESRLKSAFADEDVKFLETICEILATVIQEKSYYLNIQEKMERLALMNQINIAISSTFDLDSIFAIIVEKLKNMFSPKIIAISAWKPEHKNFVIECVYTQVKSSRIKKGLIIPAENTYQLQVVENKQPFQRTHLSAHNLSKTIEQILYKEGIRSYIIIPIIIDGEVIACMPIGSELEQEFTSKEIELLVSVANHMAVAMKNAQTFSKLQEAYENLKLAQDKLLKSEKLRVMGELAGGVGHDFNNVLSTVLGRTQLLLKKLETEDKLKNLDSFTKGLKIIEKSAQDGTQIVKRLREISKDKIQANFILIEVQELIRDVVEITQPKWREATSSKGSSINFITRVQNSCRVQGNPAELREVLINLIFNAIEAMPEGGDLILETEEKENQVLIKVKDSGTGMTEEVKNKIFEPYFTTKGERGTGLGLSVSQSIIFRHQGEILVESAPGKGSIFTVVLPTTKREKKEEKLTVASEPEKIKASLLVIEDEENLREILEEILLSQGYRVTMAKDGEEGLKLFNREKFDLVITDIGLPGISGWEVASQVKVKNFRVPVILSTGWGISYSPSESSSATDEAKILKRKGIDAVINKPFDLSQILKIVPETLNKESKKVLEL